MLALIGVITIVAGLAIDAIMHERDPALAASEGVFSLSNPSHAMFALGILMTAGGVGLVALELVGVDEFASRRAPRVAGGVMAIALVAGVALSLKSGDGHDHVEMSASTTTFDGLAVTSSFAATVDRSRLPVEQASALTALSWSRPGTIDGLEASHVHSQGSTGPTPELSVEDEAALDEQLNQARSSIPALDTIAEAEAAGYIQASTSVAGVGAHWLKWSAVDQPFDPSTPSMLLFETTTNGRPRELVGFSYWAASDGEPEGFAGDLDTWHQHYGLCFVNGWLRSENKTDRTECAGDWVNGSDLWMLHAWVNPSVPNVDGVFADVNMSICPRPTSVPDILSCSVYD